VKTVGIVVGLAVVALGIFLVISVRKPHTSAPVAQPASEAPPPDTRLLKPGEPVPNAPGTKSPPASFPIRSYEKGATAMQQHDLATNKESLEAKIKFYKDVQEKVKQGQKISPVTQAEAERNLPRLEEELKKTNDELEKK
jgi:hypothetical protein